MKFNLGQTVQTQGIDYDTKKNKDFGAFVQVAMSKHFTGNWGDLGDDDKEQNEDALKPESQGRIFSKYNIPEYIALEDCRDTAIYIITEWDRSVTTILYPSEY